MGTVGSNPTVSAIFPSPRLAAAPSMTAIVGRYARRMDRQMLDQLSTGRSRRDVQAIRDALSALSPGDPVSVVIRSPRYGLYAVDGSVRVASNGQMVVADTALGAAGEIQALSVRPGDDVPPQGGLPGSVADLHHGTVARVTFDEPAYGAFHVTGPLTAGDDAFLLVGRWIVGHGDAFAPRVVSVEVASDLDVHPANVPPRRPSVDDAVAAVPGLVP